MPSIDEKSAWLARTRTLLSLPRTVPGLEAIGTNQPDATEAKAARAREWLRSPQGKALQEQADTLLAAAEQARAEAASATAQVDTAAATARTTLDQLSAALEDEDTRTIAELNAQIVAECAALATALDVCPPPLSSDGSQVSDELLVLQSQARADAYGALMRQLAEVEGRMDALFAEAGSVTGDASASFNDEFVSTLGALRQALQPIQKNLN